MVGVAGRVPQWASVVSMAAVSVLVYSAVAVEGLAWAALFAALPLVALRVLTTPNDAWLGASLALAALAVLFSSGHAIGFFAMQVAPGMLLGEAIARGRGFVVGASWAFALLTVELALALALSGAALKDQLLAPIEVFASADFISGLEAESWPPEQIEQWRDQIDTFRAVLNVVYPAAFVVLAGLLAIANAALLRAVLLWRSPDVVPRGEFEALRLPLAVVATFILSGVSVMVPALRPVAYNLLLVVSFLFAVQGLAVVSCFVARMQGPRLLRAAVVPMMILVPLGVQLLALLGLFDNWVDFRWWARPPEDEPGGPASDQDED